MKSFPKTIPINGRVRVCLELLRGESIKNKQIIDVGSTFGWLAREIEKDKPKGYIGVEPNAEAVAFSKKNAKYAQFFEGDAAHMPIKNGIGDIAVFFDVIEHVPVDTEIECLKEIHRVLKPKATLLLSTPFDHPVTKLLDPAYYFGHRHYTKERLQKMLKQSGFTLESFEVRGGYVSLTYMILFYIAKWVFNKDLNGTWIQKEDDKSYSKEGIATVYLKAVKK